MPTFIFQAGIANLLKLYRVFDEVIKVIIDIEQLIINHNTFSIAAHSVGHIHTSLCGHAPSDHRVQIVELFENAAYDC